MIDKRFIVTRKNAKFPTYPGLLDAATRAGLMGITTQVIQMPSAENGMMAVVMARAIFEDGRVFEDVGDASPENCSDTVKSAVLRMASTRAKGRCLRDAVNIGVTMFEELPVDEPLRPLESYCEELAPSANVPLSYRSLPALSMATALDCSNQDCGRPLTKGQHDVSQHTYGQPLCPKCQKLFTRIG
jgi:hypothetical protein